MWELEIDPGDEEDEVDSTVGDHQDN